MNDRAIVIAILPILCAIHTAAVRRAAAEPVPLVFASTADVLPEVRYLVGTKDGKTLIAAHGNPLARGALSIWNLETRRELAVRQEAGGIHRLALSPNEQWLAYGTGDGRVKIRNLKTLEMVAEFPTNGYRYACVAFSPQNDKLVYAAAANQLRLVDTKSWQESAVQPAGEQFQWIDASFSPSGDQLLACGGSFDTENPFGRACAWSVASGKQLHIMKHGSALLCCRYQPDGKLLLLGGVGPRIRLFRTSDGTPQGAIQIERGSVVDLRFSADQKRLLATGAIVGLHVFDARTKKLLHHFQPAQKRLRTACWGRDWVMTGGTDRRIRLYDSETGQPEGQLPGAPNSDTGVTVTSLAFSPSGDLFAQGQEDGSVTVGNKTIAAHNDAVAAIAFSKDNLLATASYDRTVKLWNTKGESGTADKALRTLRGHTNWVFGLAFSPDGQRLASAGFDKTVRIWNVADGKPIARLPGHSAAVRSVAYSPDGQWLASAGSDGKVFIWNATTHQRVQLIESRNAPMRSVAFSPDGSLLATAGEDNQIRTWKVPSWQPSSILQGHGAMIMSLGFSADGKYLASGGMDKKVKLWNLSSGRAVQTMSGHADGVTSVAFDTKSQALVTASLDRTVRYWRPAPSGAAVPTSKLFLMNADGSGVRQLLEEDDYDAQGSPDWSRNGKWIAFDAWRARAGETASAAHVLMVDSKGGKPRDLGAGALPSFSPDGKKIVFSSYNPRGVWLMGADGQDRKLVDAAGWAATWSPDGKTIAYTKSLPSGTNLIAHDVATGQQRPLLLGRTHESRYQSIYWNFGWSPDSKQIVFRGAIRNQDNSYEVVTVDVNGSDKGFKILYTGATDNGLDWHPDGSRILLAIRPTTVKVYMQRLHSLGLNPGDKPQLIAQPSGSNNSAIWSPDGKRAVFSRKLVPPNPNL